VSWVNNQWVLRHEASISIDDRGFRFGDGLFETIRICHGKPYQLTKHLERLKQGLTALCINYDVQPLTAAIAELIERNNLEEGIVRIIITRGKGGHGYLPDPGATPTAVIMTNTPPTLPAKPISLWSSSYQKLSPQQQPTHCKTLQGLTSTLARLEAQENQCQEALLCNHKHYIAECTSNNIFWIKDKQLYTPSLNTNIIGGTVRDALLRLSPYPVHEGLYPLKTLKNADAVFTTNCIALCAPVAKLEPLGWEWSSKTYTDELNQLLKNDMESYAA